MDKKYQLVEANLELQTDMDFINNVLECYVHPTKMEPEAIRYLLDLSYTLARNQIVEARRFADLTNKPFIDVDDLRIAKIDKTDDFKLGPLQLTKPIVQTLCSPSASSSLMLPPWRSCQVGASAELKQVLAEAELKKTPSDNCDPTTSKMPRMGPPNFKNNQ